MLKYRWVRSGLKQYDDGAVILGHVLRDVRDVIVGLLMLGCASAGMAQSTPPPSPPAKSTPAMYPSPTYTPPTKTVQAEVLARTPGILVAEDGTEVNTPEKWNSVRRGEVLRMMTENVYGPMPPGVKAEFEVVEEDRAALGGKATRRQVVIRLPDTGTRMDLLMYLPNHVSRPGVVLGLNFWGNHAVHADGAIRLPGSYVEPTGPGHQFVKVASERPGYASEATRGMNASMWRVERLIERGYGLATMYRGDVDPDVADLGTVPEEFRRPLRLRYPRLEGGGGNISAMGAWAFALSRGMDYLETDGEVDSKRVALFGFSRLGKAAVWSAANDPRYAVVISSEAGAGGIKLFHHRVGQDIGNLTTRFPHWYCGRFAEYAGREESMPFDMHFTLGLIAPRAVYVSASEGNATFDPGGEFLGIKAAEPVWRLLGRPGMPADYLPPRDVAVVYRGGGFHYRRGSHDVTDVDWGHYLDFLDMNLK